MKAYQTCDIFVAPSRFESFGLVLVEAMRSGKPVIGCLAGGMTEIVEHGKCGFLVPPGDAEHLAAGMLELVKSPALRESFGRAGRQRFEEEFSSARMAAESVPLYRRARSTHETGVDHEDFVHQ